MFRLHDRFNSDTLAGCLRDLYRRFGRIAAIADGTSVHRSKQVRKIPRKNKEIKIICLPKGSPYLNPVEECWFQAKQKVMVSKYHPSKKAMAEELSRYFRTARHDLDIWKYLRRRIVEIPMNL